MIDLQNKTIPITGACGWGEGIMDYGLWIMDGG
jgi:hypothetical protein